MSNKLEAALGGAANEFTDEEGDVYAVTEDVHNGQPTIILDAPNEMSIEFFKADAAKIIALIQEATK